MRISSTKPNIFIGKSFLLLIFIQIAIWSNNQVAFAGNNLKVTSDNVQLYAEGGALLPNEQTGECTGDGIYLYEHSNYNGRCLKFTNSVSNLANVNFNDIASSIRFVGSYEPWRYRVTLCEDINYEGNCSPFFIGDDPLFGDNRIKADRASSLRIENIDYSDSLRIGTVNVQFLPTALTPDGCCEEIPGRVGKIAERIIASEYDIIILNEAFIDDIQSGLESRIREYYPHYIKYIDEDEANFDEDSGLMLFSRYPFIPIENNPHPADDVDAYNSTQGAWNSVAFLEYAEYDFGCNGEWSDGGDCAADKGVAYVRVRNPITSRIYNVVFTHMDAGSSSGDRIARAINVQVSKQLIQDSMTEPQIDTEDIFLLGDLNVDGNYKITRGEYELRFKFPSSSSFAEFLTDVWEVQSSLPDEFGTYRDPGLTSNVPNLFRDSEQKRLDYILYNYPEAATPDRKLCFQHLTIAYNLRHTAPYREAVLAQAGIQDLSDHYGVNADINRDAPHCSPDKARQNPPLDSWLEGYITYPGSMQWYRLDPIHINSTDANGTYSIQVDSDGPVDFQVFKSSNLSAPLPRRNGNAGTIGWTYQVTKEPLYIRVFSKDRTWTGGYELIIHKHQGITQADAIILPANEYFGAYLDANETKWFQIDTEAPNSGQAQNLRFGLAGLDGAATKANLELRAGDGVTILENQNGQYLTRNDVSNNNARLYLLITNQGATNTAHFVFWETDLTVLHGTLEQPIMLQVKDTTEELADDVDELNTLKIEADGIEIVNTGSIGGDNQFDDKTIRGLQDKVQPIRFLQGLQLELVEDDSGLNPNDHMYGSMGPLHPGIPLDYRRTDLTGDGGHYFLDVTLSHGLQFAFPRMIPLVPNKLLIDTTPIIFDPPNNIISKTLIIDNQNPLLFIPWTAQVSEPWVQLSAPSGTTPDAFTVMFNDTNLPGGTHRATLTLTSPNTMEAIVIPIELTVPYRMRLPILYKNFINAPDLIIDAIDTSSDTIKVVIKNQGPAAVVNEFWVDAYIDPNPAPTAVNQLWEYLSAQGLVWAVTSDALPLESGASLTLTFGDKYYQPELSNFSGTLPEGTPIYVQVDSANANTDYGAVQESHEVGGETYNNISGPVLSTSIAMDQIISESVSTGDSPTSVGHLPSRR